MFCKDRDKQTMGSIVAGAFLISFFLLTQNSVGFGLLVELVE